MPFGSLFVKQQFGYFNTLIKRPFTLSVHNRPAYPKPYKNTIDYIFQGSKLFGLWKMLKHHHGNKWTGNEI